MGTATGLLTITGLRELWAETHSDSYLRIAVPDGPVGQFHLRLTGANLEYLKTLVSEDLAEPGPAAQHGTHVDRVIFGQHDGPITGIAPRCYDLLVPIFRDGPDGTIAPCSQLDLARATNQAKSRQQHWHRFAQQEQTAFNAVAHEIRYQRELCFEKWGDLFNGTQK